MQIINIIQSNIVMCVTVIDKCNQTRNVYVLREHMMIGHKSHVSHATIAVKHVFNFLNAHLVPFSLK